MDKEVVEQKLKELSASTGVVFTPTKKSPFRRYMYAACVTFLLGLCGWAMLMFVAPAAQSGLEQAIAFYEEEGVEADSIDQVTLIPRAQTPIQIDKNSVIAHGKDGAIYIDQKEVKEVRASQVQEETKETKEEKKEADFNRLIVPKGKSSHLLLADGTSLYVNAGTEVIYPEQFGKKNREIYVNGEIFIDVTPDKNRPFVVKTSTFDVMVHGTAFNVNAYRKQEKAEVVLVRGAVTVQDKEGAQMAITPNEKAKIANGAIVGKEAVDAENYVAWTKGRLLLDGKDMNQFFHSLSVYYGTEITYDPLLDTHSLRGVWDISVPLEKVLERITRILPVSYRETEKGYHVFINE